MEGSFNPHQKQQILLQQQQQQQRNRASGMPHGVVPSPSPASLNTNPRGMAMQSPQQSYSSLHQNNNAPSTGYSRPMNTNPNPNSAPFTSNTTGLPGGMPSSSSSLLMQRSGQLLQQQQQIQQQGMVRPGGIGSPSTSAQGQQQHPLYPGQQRGPPLPGGIVPGVQSYHSLSPSSSLQQQQQQQRLGGLASASASPSAPPASSPGGASAIPTRVQGHQQQTTTFPNPATMPHQQQQQGRVPGGPTSSPGLQRGVGLGGVQGLGGGSGAQEGPVLAKRTLQDLVAQLDPGFKLDADLEEVLLEIADDFVDSVTSFSCQLAKHRRSPVVEAKDVLLHLERSWQIKLPGFGGDDYRPYRRQKMDDGHRQRLAAVKHSSILTAGKTTSAPHQPTTNDPPDGARSGAQQAQGGPLGSPAGAHKVAGLGSGIGGGIGGLVKGSNGGQPSAAIGGAGGPLGSYW